jgi:hypothetical protein
MDRAGDRRKQIANLGDKTKKFRFGTIQARIVATKGKFWHRMPEPRHLSRSMVLQPWENPKRVEWDGNMPNLKMKGGVAS